MPVDEGVEGQPVSPAGGEVLDVDFGVPEGKQRVSKNRTSGRDTGQHGRGQCNSVELVMRAFRPSLPGWLGLGVGTVTFVGRGGRKTEEPHGSTCMTQSCQFGPELMLCFFPSKEETGCVPLEQQSFVISQLQRPVLAALVILPQLQFRP